MPPAAVVTEEPYQAGFRQERSFPTTSIAGEIITDAGMAQIGPTLRPPPIGGGHHRTSRTIRAESEGSEAFSKLETAYVSEKQVCGSGPRLAKCNRTQAMSTLAHPPFLNAKISARQNDNDISHFGRYCLERRCQQVQNSRRFEKQAVIPCI
jgi:hypothetical protein